MKIGNKMEENDSYIGFLIAVGQLSKYKNWSLRPKRNLETIMNKHGADKV